jgi:hypothetical protein
MNYRGFYELWEDNMNLNRNKLPGRSIGYIYATAESHALKLRRFLGVCLMFLKCG